MVNYSKILVPVDFSTCSLEALKQACDLGRRFDSELHLLHVQDSWSSAGQTASEFQPDYQQFYAAERLAAEAELRRLPPADLGPKPVHREIRDGDPADEIVRYADENKIDLIFLGTHGRTGMKRWLMGSVAEKVVRFAHCPVQVVRMKPSPATSSAA